MTGRSRSRSRRFEEWLFKRKVIFPLFLLVSIICFMIGTAGMPYAVRSISRPLICGQPETVTGTIEAKSVRDVKAVFWIKGVKHKNTKTKAYFLMLAAGLAAIVWLIWGTGRKAPEDVDRGGELHGKKKNSKFVMVFFTIVMFFTFLYFGYMGYWRLDEILF